MTTVIPTILSTAENALAEVTLPAGVTAMRITPMASGPMQTKAAAREPAPADMSRLWRMVPAAMTWERPERVNMEHGQITMTHSTADSVHADIMTIKIISGYRKEQ